MVGLVAAVGVESLAAAKQSAPERRLLGGWLTGTLAPAHLARVPATPTVVVGMAVVLVLSWLFLAVRLTTTPTRPGVAVAVALLWATPFLAGVPILSRDCYAYLAQGEVMRRGWDPYTRSVGALGSHDRLAAAVDPLWRLSIPPYGPVGLRLSALAAWAGHAVGHPQVGLLVLRGGAFAGLALAVACISAMTPAPRRAAAIWLTMSPLMLLQLLGAGHLEGLIVGLLAAAVLAIRRDHPLIAVACAAVAGCVKITAFAVLAVLLLHVWQHSDPALRVRKAIRLTAAALVSLPIAMFAAGGADAWGWVRGLTTPTSVWDPLTPSNELLLVLRHVAAWSGYAVPKNLAVDLQVAVAGAGIAAAIAIVCRASHREPCLTGAYLVADLALCGPVLWPWYFAPIILLLVASGSVRGWVLAAAFGAPGALWGLPLPVVQMQRVAFAVQACTALAIALGIVVWSRRGVRKSELGTAGSSWPMPAGSS